MTKAQLKQWREGQTDRGLCWERSHCGKTASSRHRDIDSAIAVRYKESWQHEIDDERAGLDFSGDIDFYRRQSEWSCMFRWWGGWGRWGWWRDPAGPVERRWWTWLGNGDNFQLSTIALGKLSAEANEAWRIDTTRMGGHRRSLMWKRGEVPYIRIECSGSRYTRNIC